MNEEYNLQNENDELFRPSLSTQEEVLASYDINMFYLIGFFGGIIPLIYLGNKNAKSLSLSKKTAQLLFAVGIMILVVKYGMVYLYASKLFLISKSIIRMCYKSACLILAVMYYYFMKTSYNRFISFGGVHSKLLSDFISAFVAGIVIEGILVSVIMYLGSLYAG